MKLASIGAIPVEHFSDRHTWSTALRTVPEFSFGIDVGDQPMQLSREHSDVEWLEIGAAEAKLEWESNRVALRELDTLLTGRHLRSTRMRYNEL